MKGKAKILTVCLCLATGALLGALVGCQKDDDVVYGEWVTKIAATCENAGEEVRVSLSDSSVFETREIPATGHDWDEWEITTAPTCLTEGVETRVCKTCENIDVRAVSPLGHDWDEWETVVAPTCLGEGYETRVCLRDGSHTENRSLKALGHDWSEWVVETAPTCLSSGVETRVCRNCNDHKDYRSIDALGHDWGEYVTVKAATCTEEGIRQKVCGNDSSHTDTYTVPALGHDWSDWVVTTAPTESKDGVETRYCRNDKTHTETRVAPALGSECLSYSLYSATNTYSVACYDRDVTGTVYIPAFHEGLPVTMLALNAFMGAKKLERVVFLGESNLQIVANLAFCGCESLKSIALPEGVTELGTRVFWKCTNLQTLSLPTTLVKTLASAFLMDCPALEHITVAEGNPVYKSENDCLIERATGTLLLGSSNSVIPSSVTVIDGNAFSSSNIESVRIPAGVTEIGGNAFINCKNLTSVTFEEGSLLTVISRGAFYGCEALERISIPAGVTKIDSATFNGCSALGEVEIKGNLESISGNAFTNCDSLKSFHISASVSDLSPTAFSAKLVSIITIDEDNPVYYTKDGCILKKETNALVVCGEGCAIPQGVTEIGWYAFYDRKDLTSISIPASVKSIGYGAFDMCSNLTTVVFEGASRLETIADHVFLNCTALTSIRLPASLRTIGSGAFMNCPSLTEVTYEDFAGSCLETIGIEAFKLTGLERIEIPASVTAIGKLAFEFLTEEQTIVIKGFASEEEADEAWGTGWRDGCHATIIYEKD